MKCLVTGGAGFIGSHLARRLAELGHEVHVLDIEWPTSREVQGYIHFHQGDVNDIPIGFPQFDWCFHLAALADVVPSIERPLDYHRANVDGTVSMLNYCTQSQVKKFIFASSTSIYGIPVRYPTPEEELPAPQYPYALTKYLAEQYVMHWGRFYKLPAVSLRITTAYGPGMKSKGYGSAFKVFLAQKANNAPFTVVGDGQQSRDFIFVSDVVEAFIKAAHSVLSGEIYNIGYGRPRKISELLELLGGGNIVNMPLRPGEPAMTWADISKAMGMLGWVPQVPLEEGVAALLDHLEDWKDEVVWTRETIESATKSWFEYLN